MAGLHLPDTTEHPKPMRVGLFGGAFDPPHRAHRVLAETALSQLELDVLHLLPTGQAWHKARELTTAEHRLAMCELAFADLPRTRIDAREIHRKGPSYTVDTLAELAAEYPGAQLYLLLGADQLLAFKTWVRWRDVLAQATLVVANRTMDIGAEIPESGAPAADLMGVDLPFVRLDMPLTPISATAVRARLNLSPDASQKLQKLVPDAVAGYISRHHLYQNHL